MYITCMRERYHFSLVCAFRKAIKEFGVKVDSQNGVPRVIENMKIYMLISSNSQFYPLLSYGNSPHDYHT